jgi:hypothetical protein
MTELTAACPCETSAFPQTITNPPGRPGINYRVGDFVAFREALLRSRPGEVELANWRPGAQGDLAVQMIEWWAYVADILTFYNERIANEAYLRTAVLPESVQRLIRILGYRPRPGIGATGTLAALTSGLAPFTLPRGFQIQSKPGPGKQPQIFELGVATLIQSPDSIAADAPPDPSLLGSDGASVLLRGTITSIKPGAGLLLLEKGWTANDSNYALAVAGSTAIEKDPRNNPNTRVTFQTPLNQLSGQSAANFGLLRSQQSSHLWQYGTVNVLIPNGDGTGTAHLESIARQIQMGDPVLFDNIASGATAKLAVVVSYTEAIYYANPPGSDPSVPPAPAAIGIPILHSVIGFKPTEALSGWIDQVNYQTLTVRYLWQTISTLIPFPAAFLTSTAVSLQTPVPPALLPMVDQNVLVSGANGNGVHAQGSTGSSTPSTLGLSNFSDPTATLVSPLNVLFDLLPVSRGKTVANEMLGSGDATITTGQEFTLQKSPLTYLQSAASASGDNYSSTLSIWVNGVQWKEVPSFYGRAPDATVFVTREDENNITHVQFGDGVFGARLPSGNNNVVATYRYGSGADAPDPGTLSVILQSWPGLRSILNPVPVGGGADPDAPQRIKTYAPASVLTFGRAISADDYETIAAQAPGVARARSYWIWDATQQRMMVKVYVGDDADAVSSANTALAGASDPNRPLKVFLASAFPVTLGMTLVVHPSYVASDVLAAVTAALVDPDQGLLGANVVGIGESIWQSQMYQTCLSVPGAVAVHDLQFMRKLVPLVFSFRRSFIPETPLLTRIEPIFRPVTVCNCQDFRADPGEGGFFQLAAADLNISSEVATYAN